ncbi:MAG: Smr/MutS family protein [Deltaproteobacteria bacterium]|nr:Smr/MutS family protein [Deltaproteobacteria bacterium]
MTDSAPDLAPAASAPHITEDLGERALESLDWPRIQLALAEMCSTSSGAEYCAELPFLDSAAAATAALREVGELMTLLRDGHAPGLGGITEIRPYLEAARKGQILEGPILLEVAHTLEGFQRLQDTLRDHAERVPAVWGLAQELHPLPDLAAWLIASFDARGELSASTYPQLSSLRSAKARLHSRIRETMDSLRREDRYTDALMDDFSPMRNDRYVLPIRSGHKRSGLGIVHDASGSGQTVYIEPYELIDLNNDLKMAEAELQREERRILRDLSERLSRVEHDIARSMRAAVQLDVITAKARLGVRLVCSVPTISDEPRVRLNQARHPILVLRGLDVIANDLRLGQAQRALVLSGPNTGGKTITLKTLGLAALFARAALPFPCGENSIIGWFPEVLTDIGDHQDVEGDLSTFSGHVVALKGMLDRLDRRTDGASSLVLLDEIAVGTDPVQGAALGRAVLEAFLDRDSVLATTTHYSELKALAAQDERFLGGRVEFDDTAGRPTYRLSLGRPGSSHALDVARRVGMDPAIVTRATELLDPTAANVEELLAGLEAELAVARAERAEAESLKATIEAELAAARAERAALAKSSKSVERDVRAEFEKEVEGYRSTVRGVLRQLNKERDETSAERARQRITEGAHSVRGRLDPLEPARGPALDPSTLTLGLAVRVRSLSQTGELASLPDNKGRVTVSVRGLPVQVKVADLELAQRVAKPAKKKKPTPPRPRVARPTDDGNPKTAFRGPDNTLDLRGQRVDEALFEVDRFLDERSLTSDGWAFILHGHGTGVLKSAVRDHLKSSPYVSQTASGTRSQGGDGITVVQLR